MVQLAVNLDGGIGNLLFQYSAASTLQKRFGYEVTFMEITPGIKSRLETYIGEIEFPVSENPFKIRQLRSSSRQVVSKKPLIQLFDKILVNRLTTKWAPEFSLCGAPYSKRVQYACA